MEDRQGGVMICKHQKNKSITALLQSIDGSLLCDKTGAILERSDWALIKTKSHATTKSSVKAESNIRDSGS